MRKIVLIFFIMIFKIGLNAQVTITYVGNMGVLLSGKRQSVLIDGLHDYYYKDYQFPPQKLIQALINGNYLNFPPISLILNTHFHKDHFDEKLSLAFLSSNKISQMICSDQAKNAVSKLNNEVFRKIHTIPTVDYNESEFSFDFVKIKAFKMNHVNLERHKNVQNIGFIISIGGYNILHVGDTDWHEDIKMFEILKLNNEKIDIAILPVWMLMSTKSKSLLRKFINPKELIVSHISPNMSDSELKIIQGEFPEAYFLRSIEQKVEIK